MQDLAPRLRPKQRMRVRKLQAALQVVSQQCLVLEQVELLFKLEEGLSK